jgi:predicted nucleic acid-binding protein
MSQNPFDASYIVYYLSKDDKKKKMALALQEYYSSQNQFIEPIISPSSYKEIIESFSKHQSFKH